MRRASHRLRHSKERHRVRKRNGFSLSSSLLSLSLTHTHTLSLSFSLCIPRNPPPSSIFFLFPKRKEQSTRRKKIGITLASTPGKMAQRIFVFALLLSFFFQVVERSQRNIFLLPRAVLYHDGVPSQRIRPHL